MNMVAIQGSPHGMQGNTGRLLSAVVEGAEKAGADVEVFCLGDLNIAPCRACDACHRTGECAIGDDYQQVRDALLGADAIVFASPNYISNVTAQMKALFDRLCGPLHVNALRGKHAAAVVTAGSAEIAAVAEYMLSYLRRLGCWTVGSVGAEARQLTEPESCAEVLEQATALGARLVEAAAHNEHYPDQEAEIQAAAEHMRRLVLSRRDHWPYEYEVWQARGTS